MRLVVLLTLFYLVGCGEESSKSSNNSTGSEGPYTPAAPIEYSADFYAREGQSFTIDSTGLFSEDVSSGYTFSYENAPEFLNINTTNGELSGEPEESGLFDKIKITATKIEDGTTVTKEFALAVNGDPLRPYAWHLKNTGQKNFAIVSGDAGIDINQYDVLKNEIYGTGVRIAISDSGGEINHDDLYQNMLSGQHRDYSLNPPYLGDPIATNAHGTAVAGIVSARGWNNRGSIGVAPGAKAAIFQFLDSSQSTALLISQASGDFDIFNYSYGDVLYEDTLSDPDYLDHLKYQTLNEKKVYIKSAGNEFMLADDDICAPHNANFPYENESPYILLTSAINAEGGKATYSNSGSNIWISAPGGEYGRTYPAILSTDLPTCLKGFSRAQSDQYNDFEYNHPLNTRCHYTSTMNGTSSSTPIVAGVVALMKEVNSDLTQRDIKHILATTAVRVDPDFEENSFGNNHPSQVISGCTSLNLRGHTYEQGWLQNNAGIWFNNFYGFGLIDAKAAVTAAESYTSSLGDLQELNSDFSTSSFKSTPGLSIPDNSAAGISDSMTISNNITVESVQIRIKVTHARPGQLGIELTGPEKDSKRTKSILLNINNSLLLGTDQDLDVVLTSHAFYGEKSAGQWTVKVIDAGEGATGTMESWSLNILGH